MAESSFHGVSKAQGARRRVLPNASAFACCSIRRRAITIAMPGEAKRIRQEHLSVEAFRIDDPPAHVTRAAAQVASRRQSRRRWHALRRGSRTDRINSWPVYRADALSSSPGGADEGRF